MAEATINEALTWMKTLREREAELIRLRGENSSTSIRRYGMQGDKEVSTYPVYNVVELDRTIGVVAKEIRQLDTKIKATNAITKVAGYEINEDVLGVLVPAEPPAK